MRLSKIKLVMNAIRIDKKSRVPLYIQIYTSVMEAIQDGRLRDNDQLPYEEDVSVFYNVSRHVVRQAYDELSKDGHIIRIKRKGTFVQTKPFFLAKRKELLNLETLITSRHFEYKKKEIVKESVFTKNKSFPNCFRDHYIHALKIVSIHYANNMPVFLVETFIPVRSEHDKKILIKNDAELSEWLSIKETNVKKLILGINPKVSNNIESLSLNVVNESILTEHSINYLNEQGKSIAFERIFVDGEYFYLDVVAHV